MEFTFLFSRSGKAPKGWIATRVTRLFGKAPSEPPGRASEAVVWALVDLEPVKGKFGAVHWAEPDGSPPQVPRQFDCPIEDVPEVFRKGMDPLPIAQPIFVPIWHNTTKRDLEKIRQICQRTMKNAGIHASAHRDQRFERGSRYWAQRYGLGVTPWPWMSWTVLAYLADRSRPRQRTLLSLSVEKGISVEAVRKDVAHFKRKADQMFFVNPTWGTLLAKLSLPADLKGEGNKAESFGDLVRLVEKVSRWRRK